ncbi:MAG TPA: glycosyltransferase family 4 protein, partial [bacterium]|nr:glycosyltransferase family 4 protein [bacterium]
GVPFALWTKELDFLDVDPYNCLRDWLMLLPRHFKSWVLSSSRRLSDRIKSESDAYLAFSEMAKEHIVSKGGKPGRIVQICNSIDMERFLARISESRQGDKLQDFRKQRGWEGKTVLLSLSYLLRRKGIHILLEAFSRLQVQDTVLAIVGDGPFRATLQETARRLGLQNVEFHPYTHDSHLYYLSSDALILPTLGPEPWGLTVNEALLCGIPAIVTTNVGAREIIPHHELVVTPGDSEALCRAMQFIISDVALRESYRKLGPKIVHEECSVEQAGRGLAEAFRLAVESSC